MSLGFAYRTKPDRHFAVQDTDVAFYLLRFSYLDPLTGDHYPFTENDGFKFLNRQHDLTSWCVITTYHRPEGDIGEAALTVIF